jgi:DNA-binding MarR family transcriptional regulator
MEQRYSIQELIRRIENNWPETATPENAVVLCLVRLAELTLDKSKSKLAPLGLTQAGFEVLITLRSLPKPHRLTPTELHKSILVTSGGMSKVLRNLEADGYITRRDNPDDRRSMYIELTPKGEESAVTAMAEVATGDREVLSTAYSDQELHDLRQMLQKGLARLEN